MESDLHQAVDSSIVLNNERWGDQSPSIPFSSDLVEAAKSYFDKRKIWLEKNISIYH
jgi:hypothetical protein